MSRPANVDAFCCALFAAIAILLVYTREFWSFLIALAFQLVNGGGVEGFPSPSVF